MAGKLTPRQKAFAELYDGNATQTAIKVGYAEGSAEVTGARMLRNAKVLEIIKAREDDASRKRIASRQRRQEFWTEAMEDAEVDMKDRLKASELLGKSECDFTDKVLHSGGVETVIEIRDRRNG